MSNKDNQVTFNEAYVEDLEFEIEQLCEAMKKLQEP